MLQLRSEENRLPVGSLVFTNGINRTSDGNIHNYARIDSDRARDLDTRRSGSTCASFGNGALLAWKSKLQPTVATSTIKAEHLTLRFGTCETIGLNMTVKKLGYAAQKPISVYEDNQSALYHIKPYDFTSTKGQGQVLSFYA